MPKTKSVRQKGHWPPVKSEYEPGDYANPYFRGTVEYDPKWKNYSYQKVTIDGGTVVNECNFSQAFPLTVCFTVTGAGGLTFNNCNLSNVLVDPSWTLNNCSTYQNWAREITDGFGRVSVEREFICKKCEDIKDNPPIPPLDVIKPPI